MKYYLGKTEVSFLGVLALSVFLAVPAVADTIAFSVPLQAGNQVFVGSLGMDFNVNSSIYLTGMGVFDPNAIDNQGIAGDLTVVIYDRDTTQQVPGTLTVFKQGTTGPLTGANLIAALDPALVLLPGHYSVVAWGYKRESMNGNNGISPIVSIPDDGGGLISFVGLSRFGYVGAYPTYIDSGPYNRYLAGTFTFRDYEDGIAPNSPVTAPIPEPTTIALLAPALFALCRKVRRS